MDLEQIWQSALGEIEVQLSRANFATWMKQSRLVDKKDGTFYVALPNNFAKEWVQNKYSKQILGILRGKDDTAKKVEFSVESPSRVQEPKKNVSVDLSMMDNKIDLDFKVDPDTNLNPRYTFQAFIVGPSNELAFAAAEAIVTTIGSKYNPFFIYGGVGLGKTHLIQAIGNEILIKYNRKVRPK